MIKVAVVGSGFMTRNYIRVFSTLPQSSVTHFADFDRLICETVAGAYPDISVSQDIEATISSPDIDAVAVTGRTGDHFAQAKLALETGKGVIIEKPMASNVEQASILKGISDSGKLTLMIAHILSYHPAMVKMKDLVDSGELGDLLYIYSRRVNLGRVRRKENALWALAPYDIAAILELTGKIPQDVSARGSRCLNSEIEDVIFLNMSFQDGLMANLQLSWLDPQKKRQLTVVGNRKMAVFDDMEVAEKVRIYDKGADRRVDFQSYEEFLNLRDGNIHIPRISLVEPLLVQCGHFLECMEENKDPRTGAQQGLEVVSILQAAQESLDSGRPVSLK